MPYLQIVFSPRERAVDMLLLFEIGQVTILYQWPNCINLIISGKHYPVVAQH